MKDEFYTLDLSNQQLTKIPVSSGRIQWLILSNNNLVNLENIEHYKYITRLALNDNNLVRLNKLNQLQRLTWLDLTRNRLSELPVLTLPNIQGLGLSENCFDTIPPCIFSLVSLRKFGFFSNRIRLLSPLIGNLINLTKLDLSNNRIERLPPELFQLIRLTWLNLSSNRLTSVHGISTLTNLEELGLGNNRLTEIDISLPKLKILPLFNNRLHTVILDLPHIEKLDLSDNSLTTFDWYILECRFLKYLNLKNNRIACIYLPCTYDTVVLPSTTVCQCGDACTAGTDRPEHSDGHDEWLGSIARRVAADQAIADWAAACRLAATTDHLDYTAANADHAVDHTDNTNTDNTNTNTNTNTNINTISTNITNTIINNTNTDTISTTNTINNDSTCKTDNLYNYIYELDKYVYKMPTHTPTTDKHVNDKRNIDMTIKRSINSIVLFSNESDESEYECSDSDDEEEEDRVTGMNEQLLDTVRQMADSNDSSSSNNQYIVIDDSNDSNDDYIKDIVIDDSTDDSNIININTINNDNISTIIDMNECMCDTINDIVIVTDSDCMSDCDSDSISDNDCDSISDCEDESDSIGNSDSISNNDNNENNENISNNDNTSNTISTISTSSAGGTEDVHDASAESNCMPFYALSVSKQLSILDLSNNRFSCLPFSFYYKMRHVGTLRLSSNRFRVLPDRAGGMHSLSMLCYNHVINRHNSMYRDSTMYRSIGNMYEGDVADRDTAALSTALANSIVNTITNYMNVGIQLNKVSFDRAYTSVKSRRQCDTCLKYFVTAPHVKYVEYNGVVLMFVLCSMGCSSGLTK